MNYIRLPAVRQAARFRRRAVQVSMYIRRIRDIIRDSQKKIFCVLRLGRPLTAGDPALTPRKVF